MDGAMMIRDFSHLAASCVRSIIKVCQSYPSGKLYNNEWQAKYAAVELQKQEMMVMLVERMMLHLAVPLTSLK